jgi:hypothetical protein
MLHSIRTSQVIYIDGTKLIDATVVVTGYNWISHRWVGEFTTRGTIITVYEVEQVGLSKSNVWTVK